MKYYAKFKIRKEMVNHHEEEWVNPEKNLIKVLENNIGKVLSFHRKSTMFDEKIEYYLWNKNTGSLIGDFTLIATDNGYNCQLSRLIDVFYDNYDER